MPISLLIALLIAFGIDLPGPEVPAPRSPLRLLETAGGVLVIALLAFGLGGWVASRSRISGTRRAGCAGVTCSGRALLTVAGLGVYAWILYEVGWSKLVLSTWGLRGLILVDDLAVLFPFLLVQLLIWSGLYVAERAPARPPRLSAPAARTWRSRRGKPSASSCRWCSSSCSGKT